MADHDTHDHTGVPGVGTGTSTTTVATDTLFDAKGDLAVGTGANTSAKLTVGANDTIPMADSGEVTGIKWVASASPSAVGTAAAVGTADTFTRGDHVHAHEAAHLAHDTLWDAAGDLAVGSGADTAAKLSIGAAGKFLRSDGTTASWVYPPGNEFDYAQITSDASITATSEATANTVITGAGVSYDGATVVQLEFFTPYIDITTQSCVIVLYDGATSIGLMGQLYSASASQVVVPVHLFKRFTPSNATHTYSIRAYVNSGTATIKADTGVINHWLPAFMRISKIG